MNEPFTCTKTSARFVLRKCYEDDDNDHIYKDEKKNLPYRKFSQDVGSSRYDPEWETHEQCRKYSSWLQTARYFCSPKTPLLSLAAARHMQGFATTVVPKNGEIWKAALPSLKGSLAIVRPNSAPSVSDSSFQCAAVEEKRQPTTIAFRKICQSEKKTISRDEWRDATSFHTHSSSTSFSSVLPNDEEFPELKKNKARIEEEFYRKTPDLINLADEKEFVKKTNCNCKDQNEEYRDRRLSYEAEKQPFLNLKRNSYNKKSISANGAHLTSASSLSSETSVDNLNCNDETKFQIKKHPITEFHKSIDDLFYSEKLDGCFPDKPRRSVSASNGATIDKTFQLTTSKPNEFSNENIASNYFEQDFFIPQSNISHLKKTNENKSGNQKGFTSDLKIEGQENERESGRLVRKVNFNETLEKNESNGTAHDNKTTHIGNIINNAPNFKKTVIVDGGNASIGASKLQNVLPFSCARNRLLASNLPSSAYRDTRKMSLVGKPLIYKNHRTDQRFRRTQSYIHNFLERPRGWKAASYHLAVLVMVLSCLALSVFSTMPEFEEQATIILYYIEIIFVFWLGVEYLCRLWSAGCRSRYRGVYGRLRFATSAYCIIDIIVISASVVVLCMGATGQVFAASAIRGLRFFQILRMLRIDRRAGTWKLLGSVVWAHRQELLTTLYIGFLGLVFSSFLFYLFEKSYNDKYTTFADALWWGVITLSTVGYGDVTPSTGPGKIIGSFCALLGVSFFALPAGILGSGFALKVQQHQRQKHLIRRRVPAARLIQCLWREYCASPESRSVATWKVHLQPPPPIMFRSNVLSANGISAPPVQSGLISRLRQSARRKPINTNTDESADEYLRSNVSASDISTAALQDASVKTLIVPRPVADNISIMSASDISEIESLGALGFSLGSWSKSKHKSSSSNNCYHHHYYQHEHHNHCQSIPTSKRMFGYGGGVGCTSELNADENVSHRHIANSSSLAPPGLRPEAKKTTNFFGVASKLSRPSTSPLPARNRDRDVATNDNESTPQSPLLAMPSSSGKFLKANINIPLKGRTSRSLSLRDSDPAALLIGDFMVAPLHEWAKKMRVQSASATSTSCVNSTMIACATGGGGAADNEYVLGSSATGVHGVVGGNAFLASDDNIMDSSSQLGADEETPPFVLRAIDNYTPQIKNVVRAVRRMQLILARRKFKEALKPYDVKDVIEQYSAGHVDLQARVKKVQEKLDEIVGGKRSNKESSGDVLKVTLANRVIKVERQVEKIDKKIDLLVEMFLEEKRIRLIANNTTAISTAAATTVISGTEFAASFSAPPGSSLSSAGNICVQCAIQQQKQNSHLREFNTQNSGSFVTGHPANQKINIARDGRNHKILHSSISLSQRPASNIVSGCDLHTRRHKIHEAQKNNQNIPIRLNSQTDNDKHNHQRQERIDGNKMIPSPLIFSSLTQRVSPVLANKNNDKEEFMVLKSDEKNFETGFNIRKRNFSSESDSILSQYENKLLLEDQDFAKEKKTYFEHINVEKEKISEAKFAVENEKIGDNNTEETIRLIAAETINNVKRLEDDKSETPLLDQSKSKTIQIHPNDSMA